MHWGAEENVHAKNKDWVLPFLRCQWWSSFDDKTVFPGARAILTGCGHPDLFFLKPSRNVSLTCFMLFVLTSRKTVLLWSSSLELVRGSLLRYSPQFISDKALFYSYHRWFIGYFHWEDWTPYTLLGVRTVPLIIKDQSMNQNQLFCVTDAVFTQWLSLAIGGLVQKENWNWLFYHVSYSSPKDLSVLHCEMTSDIVVSE